MSQQCRRWLPLVLILAIVSTGNSQWIIETVDIGFANYSKTYIIVDGANYPHIAYLRCYTNNLKYAEKTSGTWNTQSVVNDAYTTAGGPTLALSMAFDTLGYPWITYTSGSEFTQVLKVAFYDGSSWDTMNISAANCPKASLAFNLSGEPAVGYQNTTEGFQELAIWDGTSWNYDSISPGTYPTGKPSLLIDTVGNYCYAYDIGPLPYGFGVPGSWNIDTVDDGRWTSMKFDTLGRPNIAYTKPMNTDLWLASFNGSAWVTSLVDTGHGSGPQLVAPSLDIDTLNQIHIAYLQQMALAPGQYRLKYGLYNGISWQFEQIDSGFVWHVPSLAVEPDGSPHVSYQKSNELKHAFKGPTAIELSSLTALPSWNGIVISWRMENESSIAQYLIMRKGEGGSYHEIAALSGSGSSPIPRAYSYRDEDVEWSVRYYYKLGIMKEDGNTIWHGPISAVLTPVEGYVEILPNPFADYTKIKLSVPRTEKNGFGSSATSLSIHDVTGRVVKTFPIPNSQFPISEVVWYGTDDHGKKLPAGIYYCRLTSGSYTQMRKLLLLR